MLNLLVAFGLFVPSSTTIVVVEGKERGVLPLHPRFRSHLKCPYADQWLAKGPERAAFDLGLDANGRKLQSSSSSTSSSSSLDSWNELVRGSCSYTNSFSGEMTCLQFQGIGWTDESAFTRCAQESDSSFSTDSCSDETMMMAGWCEKQIGDGIYENTLMVLSSMADCDGNKMACGTFIGGSYIAAGECSTTMTTTTSATTTSTTATTSVSTSTTSATSATAAAATNDNIFSGETSSTEINSKGSCTYANAFSGGTTCLQFQGEGWSNEDMTARCAQESGSTFGTDGCSSGDDTTTMMAGWCEKMITDEKYETTLMVLSSMADCAGNKMACETFVGGIFLAAGECLATTDTVSEEVVEATASSSSGEATSSSSWTGAAATGDVDSSNTCLLAPGAIGAAHQAGFSKGYSSSCPDTPAQESPYMWPLRWSADVESKSMSYGSDDVVFTSRGKTFYMLDKNMKRSDTTFQEGLLRTIGQGPCEDIDEDSAMEGFLACRKNQTDGTMSTMIHREHLMYFISWKDDESDPVQPGEVDATKIDECSMIDLAVIGNIRPDWFLDKRGDNTDVQYLGDQHIFYASGATSDGAVPKLVKQWRKKDFASQYFVMSVMSNPPNKLAQNANATMEENMHWPLILNIPGEGFGDDMLQIYRNQEVLSDEDEELFQLVANFEASGGVCIDIRAEMGGDDAEGFGPPVLEEGDGIPSNLEVDPNSWFSNEYTFSPIWESSIASDVSQSNVTSPDMNTAATSLRGKSVLKVSDRVTVEACYDESTQLMDMSIHFHDVEPTSDGLFPWMAIAYRQNELCAMTPTDGGSTPIILLTQSTDVTAPEAYKTMLPPEAKGMSQEAFTEMINQMQPLGDAEEYTDVFVASSFTATQVERSPFEDDDTISLYFKQAFMPSVMHLTYAIGMTSQLGSHTTRVCFEMQADPCGVVSARADNLAMEDFAPETSVTAISSPSSLISPQFALYIGAILLTGLVSS